MSKRISFTAKKKLKEKLEKTSEKTGLSQSEIARRGILSQIRKLQK